MCDFNNYLRERDKKIQQHNIWETISSCALPLILGNVFEDIFHQFSPSLTNISNHTP